MHRRAVEVPPRQDDVVLGEEVGCTYDILIPGPASQLRARVYTVGGSTYAHSTSASVLVYFHGGGFVAGGLDAPTDDLCRALASAVPCKVVSIAYRYLRLLTPPLPLNLCRLTALGQFSSS